MAHYFVTDRRQIERQKHCRMHMKRGDTVSADRLCGFQDWRHTDNAKRRNLGNGHFWVYWWKGYPWLATIRYGKQTHVHQIHQNNPKMSRSRILFAKDETHCSTRDLGTQEESYFSKYSVETTIHKKCYVRVVQGTKPKNTIKRKRSFNR